MKSLIFLKFQATSKNKQSLELSTTARNDLNLRENFYSSRLEYPLECTSATRTTFSRFTFLFAFSFLALSCASVPKFDAQKIRPWNSSLENEYPQEKSVIAHYHKSEFDLYYLAARHTNTMGSDTLNLVSKLFDHKFNVLLIKSIPYSSGESPHWFVEEAKQKKEEQIDLSREARARLPLFLQMKRKFHFLPVSLIIKIFTEVSNPKGILMKTWWAFTFLGKFHNG